MSSLITTYLPILDKECLLQALDNLGLQYKISNKSLNNSKMIIQIENVGISLRETEQGFTATSSYNNQLNVNNIYRAYEKELLKKQKRLQEEQESLRILNSQLKENQEKLMKLAQQAEQERLKKIKDEIEKMEKERLEKEKILEKLKKEEELRRQSLERVREEQLKKIEQAIKEYNHIHGKNIQIKKNKTKQRIRIEISGI